jgi:thiopurine S-methyltransferase
MQGPPFSVCRKEIYRLYQKSHEILPLVNFDVAGGLKGICAAKEYLWLLKH